MNLTLRPDQEIVIAEAIRAGFVATADEVLALGVEAVRQRLESWNSPARHHEIDTAAQRLSEFGAKHRFSLGDLSVKDLINEGRR